MDEEFHDYTLATNFERSVFLLPHLPAATSIGIVDARNAQTAQHVAACTVASSTISCVTVPRVRAAGLWR